MEVQGSKVQGSRVQGLAQPPAKKTAGLIENETNEHRTSNVQHRIMYSVYFKKDWQNYSAEMPTKAESDSTRRHSTQLSSSQASVRYLQSALGGFDIQWFACRKIDKA